MTWFRVDDAFHSHSKVIEAGNAAVGLWIRCGCWSANHLTDGKIPRHIAKTFGTSKEIAVLTSVGLWDEDDAGYVIPDWLEFNPSGDEVRAQRAEKHEAKVRAGRAGGIASGQARAKQTRSTAEANGKQIEAPTRPDPLSTSNYTTSQSVGAVQSVDIRRADSIERYVEIAAQREEAAGRPIRKRESFTRTVIAAMPAGEPDRLLALFPTAPASVIAAAMHGEKGALRVWPRSDEIAPVCTDMTEPAVEAATGPYSGLQSSPTSKE